MDQLIWQPAFTSWKYHYFFLNSDRGLKGPRELHPVYSWWVCFKIGALKETKAYNKVLNIYTNKKSDQALGPLHWD
jgi:hypothetical protein